MRQNDTPEPALPRIVRDRTVLYGKPRLDGTRWPTEIAVAFRFDPFAIKDQYPHLTPFQIAAAIAYEGSWHRRFRRRLLRALMPAWGWIVGNDER